ncbi:MAG: hypothetical protein JO110_21875, partial [Acetobacteraceae bacterium]|nr:hypothetical protein [Acetobacteraceae bacterium]
MDISSWLRDLGLERYQGAFEEQRIDAQVLPELTAEDLIGLGISAIGDRRKLLAAIAKLGFGPNKETVLASEAGRKKAAAPGRLSEAEHRQLTIMFCDLVSSTGLSARLDPESLRDLLKAYHDCCFQIISGHGGFLAKYMGDGVLAYFG